MDGFNQIDAADDTQSAKLICGQLFSIIEREREMSKLLYIKASPRIERSKSTAVADAFIEAYRWKHSDDVIDTLNLFEESLPVFDGLVVQAKYVILHGREHSEEELQAWSAVEKIIERFVLADKFVLAVPMWNFSIPYRLKQYIDVLVQPGYTFSYSEDVGYKGLVLEKPLLAVYARGGEYPTGTEAEAFDLQKKGSLFCCISTPKQWVQWIINK